VKREGKRIMGDDDDDEMMMMMMDGMI